MKKLSVKLLAFLVVFSGLFYSCGGNQEAEEETTAEVSTTPSDSTDEVTYVLPSPLQIVSLFKNAGLEYVGGLTNPKENVNTYNAKTGLKINFGVYAADMSYAITNNQNQEAINYLNALRQMSEKIWMTDVFNSTGVAERLEKNVGKEDSLTSIMADLQMQLDDYLDENGSSSAGAVIFAGAWIESMYLALNSNKNTNEKLTLRISEQAVIIDNIINAVKQANEDKEYDGLITSMEKIKTNMTTAENSMSTEQLTNLKITITEIRTNLIKG